MTLNQEITTHIHPKENDANPTKQRDDAVWADSIFGVDVTLREERPIETFSPSFARIPEIVRELHANMAAEDANLNKKITVEMVNY